MTIDEIRKRKKELGLSNKQLAEKSGVSLSTLQKILGNTTTNPRYETLYALENALKLSYSGVSGIYTIEDYLALPEGVRAELIDGVFYDMSAPSTRHQQISMRILRKLGDFIDANGGTCVPFSAPTDVQPDKDDKTVVQPDIFVVCDREKIHDDRIFGAPDFIIEILSKATRSRDMKLKLRKYMEAGVREYWIINPDKKKIIVHIFDDEMTDTFIYGFDDSIPVVIFDNKLIIDFSEIYEHIRFLY